jgi:hypothetical protein
MVRKSVLHAIGAYKSSLPHAGDFEFWMRAASVSNVGYVSGAPQAYYRTHATNMHNVQFKQDDPMGMVIDLEQRHACFVAVLQDNVNVAESRILLARACHSLAREALTLAIRSYEWGLADCWPVSELSCFAETICPPSELRSLWGALTLRRKLGATRCRRNPLFLPSMHMYKVQCCVMDWRWRRAGL